MANNFEMILDADFFIGDAATPPVLEVVQDRPCWAFDAAVDEIIRSKMLVCPDEFTGAGVLFVDVYFSMVSTAAGNVVFGSNIEAITEADALDMFVAEGFAGSDVTVKPVPAATGRLGVATITITKDDSLTEDDYFRIKLFRNATHASDNASGDARVFGARIREKQ